MQKETEKRFVELWNLNLSVCQNDVSEECVENQRNESCAKSTVVCQKAALGLLWLTVGVCDSISQ